jgi:cytochrome b subunit of formate dehydrogenase
LAQETVSVANSVRKYSASTILTHWLLVVSILGLILTGGIPLINKLIDYLNLFNLTIPLIPGSTNLHYFFGFLLIFSVIFKLTAHTGGLKAALGGNSRKDLSGFIHSIYYIVFMVEKLQKTAAHRFYGYQKISILLTVFGLWMQIFSGLILFTDPLAGSTVHNIFHYPLVLMHYLGAFLILFLVIFHIAIIARRLDMHAIKSIFVSGKVPMWYVKKNHRLWYDEINEMK